LVDEQRDRNVAEVALRQMLELEMLQSRVATILNDDSLQSLKENARYKTGE